MSVAFMNAVVKGLRYNRVPVSFEPGWERRGNGQSSAWEGCITHHTGSGYGQGLSILIHGRSDLPGPLCNVCTYPDGRIHVIAAHPANHAGAAGGSWARPFPDTRNFNRMVLGNEVMYPGFEPWTPAQYRSARVFAGVVCGILRRPNPEWARGHYETSVTGKWDPGIGNGRAEWFPMHRFRGEIWAALRHDTAPPPPPNQGAELDAAERRMLENVSAMADRFDRALDTHAGKRFIPEMVVDIFKESTQRLPSRVEGSTYKDTVLGYAANADKYGYQQQQELADIKAALQQILTRLDSLDSLENQ